MNRFAVLVILATGLAACSKNKSEAPAAVGETSSATSAATTTSSGESETSTVAAAASAEETPAPAPQAPEAVVSFKDFATPESVLYDEKNDCYLVSNVNGDTSEHDNNGFISKLGPDGSVIALKWIEGGKGKVKLDAPKGTAIVGDTLYVADIDTVRMFALKTGAPKGEIKVKGASFLNDVTAAADGRVFVTDTAVKYVDGKPNPTGVDAVYMIGKNKKVVTVAKSTDLGGPNGVILVDNKLWIVSLLSGELYALEPKAGSTKSDTQKLTKGMLDGIVVTPNGILVSSWEAPGVFKGAPGGDFISTLAPLSGPADIGFDSKRSRVLVPRFMDNTVEVYSVQ